MIYIITKLSCVSSCFYVCVTTGGIALTFVSVGYFLWLMLHTYELGFSQKDPNEWGMSLLSQLFSWYARSSNDKDKFVRSRFWCRLPPSMVERQLDGPKNRGNHPKYILLTVRNLISQKINIQRTRVPWDAEWRCLRCA